MLEQTSVTANRLAWSIADTSIATGFSAGFLRREIKAGRLRARRAGKKRLFILDRDLRQYLEMPRASESDEVLGTAAK